MISITQEQVIQKWKAEDSLVSMGVVRIIYITYYPIIISTVERYGHFKSCFYSFVICVHGKCFFLQLGALESEKHT